MTFSFPIHSDALLRAIFAAREAAAAIMEVYAGPFEVEYKTDRSPLTIADRSSHEVIASRLTDLPLLSEEGKDVPYEERAEWDSFWLVDPLDGTKEFVKRNGEFTVNIARIDHGSPTLGVIAVPAKDLLYCGEKGLGAYRMPLSAVVETDLREAAELIAHAVRLPSVSRNTAQYTIAGSRSHPSEKLEAFIRSLYESHGEIAFVAAGSSLKFCLVAEGSADCYPRFGTTMEWDSAAGHFLIEECGGKVVAFETGEPLAYNKRDLRNPHFLCTATR